MKTHKKTNFKEMYSSRGDVEFLSFCTFFAKFYVSAIIFLIIFSLSCFLQKCFYIFGYILGNFFNLFANLVFCINLIIFGLSFFFNLIHLILSKIV